MFSFEHQCFDYLRIVFQHLKVLIDVICLPSKQYHQTTFVRFCYNLQ